MNESVLETLTAAQLATLLQVTLNTVYKWKAAGRLPPVLPGAEIRWSRRVVDAWLDGKTAPSK